MSSQCIYCGNAGSSKEHVWPKWIREHAKNVMGIDPVNVQEYRGTRQHRASAPSETFEKKGHSRLSLVIRHPCVRCNNEWLSLLETAVAPILTPMIEGSDRGLSYHDARILHNWATKTALHIAYASERGFTYPVPTRLANELYAGRADNTPVRFVKVWVAKYEPLGQFAYRHMAAQGFGVVPINGEVHQVIRVIMFAGLAGFYVRMPDVSSAQPLAWRDPLTAFRALHSVRDGETVPWSGATLSDSGVSQAMNRHINAEIYPGEDLGVWSGLEAPTTSPRRPDE